MHVWVGLADGKSALLVGDCFGYRGVLLEDDHLGAPQRSARRTDDRALKHTALLQCHVDGRRAQEKPPVDIAGDPGGETLSMPAGGGVISQ